MAGGVGNKTTFGIFKTGSVIAGGLAFRGTWDANSNTPTLFSPWSGVAGEYYVVSVAGNTNLDGITDWQVGDWAVWNGTAWQKIDNTDQVTSVNGLQGAVSIGLPSVLGEDNTTGAHNISINSGQTIDYNVGLGGSLNSLSTTALRNWNLPDASGTIALLSDIPATPTLSAVLTAGNTTGANDISVDSGQKITFGGAGKYIEENLNILELISDTQIRAETTNSFFRLDNNGFEVTNNASGSLKSFSVQYLADRVQYRNAVAGLSLSYALVTANRVQTLQDANGTIALLSDIPSDTNLYNTSGSIPTSTDRKITLPNTSNLEVVAGNLADTLFKVFGVGAVQMGAFNGTTIGGIQFDWANNKFDAQKNATAFVGSLSWNNITANRGWNLPDASGTIALLSDIPSTPTLSSVLTAGNTTGANNIIVSASTGVRAIVSDTADAYRLQFGATSISLRKGDFLKGNIDLNANQLNLRYSDTLANYVNFYMNTPTTTTGIFQFTTTMSAGAELRVGNNVDFVLVEGASALTLTRNLTADRSQAFQDASGTIALLSDIPPSIVTGTGTTNYSTRWTSASTIGDGRLQDNGTTTSIGASPNGNIDLLISTTRTSGIVVNNSGTNVEQYAYGSSMNGASTLSVGVNLQIANATTNVGVRVASGSLPNTSPTIGYDYGVHITAKGSTQGNIGGYFRATGGTSRNALWLVDGTEGDGKVLTSDADGKTSWQTIRTGEVYSVTGLTTDRTFNANSVTLNELADIVGTLITDLQGVNILS